MPSIKVQQIKGTDLKALETVLEDWVTIPETGEIDHDRIERILTLVQVEPAAPGDRIYLVARDEKHHLAGMVGYKAPCNYMQSFCRSDHAAEIINFYPADHFADPKIADAILDFVEKEVGSDGGEEIVVNRAPRYADETDAYFKQKKGYKEMGVAEDFFGEGFDAPVWVKKLK